MSRYRDDDYGERGASRQPPRRREEEDYYGRRGRYGDYYGGGREPDDYGGGRGAFERGGGRYFEDERRAYVRGSSARERDYDDADDYGRRGAFEEGGGREYFRRPYDAGEERAARHGGATRSHLRCRDIMTRDVTVATRATTLGEVARMMKDEDTGVIPVVERADAADAGAVVPSHAVGIAQGALAGNGKLVGLITDRDIVVRAVAEGRDAATTRAEEIMTTDIHTAQPNDRVIEVIRKMGDKQVRRVPIVDRENNLRGIISMADVALETEDDRELAEALEEISSGSSFWNRVFG